MSDVASTPCFDELFCVSDLHIGGAPGFQMFHQGLELAALMDHASLQLEDNATPEGEGCRKVALVLNGDIVDFLAEGPRDREHVYVDADKAPGWLARILDDRAFKPIWAALHRFVTRPGARLVLALGNHDIELALPRTRAVLMDALCGDDPASRGRVHFAMDTAGFRCRVGEAEVLCLHGNEVDAWNVVQPDELLAAARLQNRGMPQQAWVPNAGTRMVIDVMNDLKRRYCWIDLLKPEKPAVIPLLVAMEPSVLGRLRKLPAIVARTLYDGAFRLLAAGEDDGSDGEPSLDLLGDEQLMKALAPLVPADAGAESARDLMRRVEAHLEDGKDGLDLLESGDDLLFASDLFGWITKTAREGRSVLLRRAIKAFLGFKDPFDPSETDETFEGVDERVGAEVDFVLAGHTHFCKLLERSAGGGWYLNTGTWAGLIRMHDDWLEDPNLFDQVWQALDDEQATYESLMATEIRLHGDPTSLIMHRPTFAHLVHESGGGRPRVVGSLRIWTGEDGSSADSERKPHELVTGTDEVERVEAGR